MKIKLVKISDIYELVKCATSCNGDVIVKQDSFVVDAKSLLGLYLIDWTRPATLETSKNMYGEFEKFEVK